MVQYVNLLADTICSPITAPGYSGVAVIRVSGDEALKWTKAFIKNLPETIESHRCYLGNFSDADNVPVDQVLATYFAKNQSFTGDESVEISCHGNPLIVNQITNAYLKKGCRTAERGEFSFRAFYNGKIDLVQAEAIQQLVLTKNHIGSHVSLEHLKGKLSERFKTLEDDLILALSHLEASIDFVEQDIDTADYGAIETIAARLKENIDGLIKTYDVGKTIAESYRVLLVGPTNVGKSSLFNKIFGENKAIVTDIAGTTRDLISGQLFLGNNNIELMDSAGLRESADPIEKIGMGKTLEKMGSTDLLLYIIDSSQELDFAALEKLPLKKTLFVFNKMDLMKSAESETLLWGKLQGHFNDIRRDQILFVSALEDKGVEFLAQTIENRLVHSNQKVGEQAVVTQARHYNHLVKLKEHLATAHDLLDIQESPDLISQELTMGLSEVHRLLGKEYDDQILDKIFAEFCLGK